MKTLRSYQVSAVKECWEALIANNEPVLLMASVGAGKSLMLASILKTMQCSGKRALCLVNSADLVLNNHKTFVEEGGHASIYCAALKSKDTSAPIVFGTPQSVVNGINNGEPIGRIKFNMIIVDEAHNINHLNHRTCFMQILRHYQELYPQMRLLGATGTNFRFKGTKIVGEKCLFKKQVPTKDCITGEQIEGITTEWLIENGYLVSPTFDIPSNLQMDFSKVKIKKNGKFDQKQLQDVVDRSKRLTQHICEQLIKIMNETGRFGVFIFATTRAHAFEIMGHLPANESALILGETSQKDRTRYLEGARTGEIRYLVNIAIISVGVDVPAFDTVVYMRPTESLVLLVQTMGRGLRLSPATYKNDVLVLDYAGNIERHRDWDNPILLKAVAQTIDYDEPFVMSCPSCLTMNTQYARRCIGMINEKRCDFYFEFKPCPECGIKNDIAARQCRECGCEIIDPNAKLSLKQQLLPVKVLEAKYSISGTDRGFRVNCVYKCQGEDKRTGDIYEYFSPMSDKAMRLFYGQFVKQHSPDASKWYVHLYKRSKVEELLQTVNTPHTLMIAPHRDGAKIKKKIFEVLDGQ
jgi:DNA repair protein RadD